MKRLIALGAVVPALIAAGVAAAPEVKEWTVPWERTRPRDPFVDATGRVWFVGQAGNYVAYLDPKSGQFKRYELEDGTHPHNLVVDSKGTVWFTGNRNGRLVSMDPATGKLTNHMMPDAAVRDPHTMIFDRTGNAWFTAQQAGVVGRRDGKTGQIRIWKTGAETRPYGIVTDERGRVWFNLFGTNKIGMIDPANMNVREFALADAKTRNRRIGVTADGIVWYTDYSRGFLGRLDPTTGAVREFALPSGQRSLPYAMAVDDRGKIWVSETGVRPNRIVGFDSKRSAFTDTLEVGGGAEANTIRHMVFHAPTREVWFGTDLNTVGRVALDR